MEKWYKKPQVLDYFFFHLTFEIYVSVSAFVSLKHEMTDIWWYKDTVIDSANARKIISHWSKDKLSETGLLYLEMSCVKGQ